MSYEITTLNNVFSHEEYTVIYYFSFFIGVLNIVLRHNTDKHAN